MLAGKDDKSEKDSTDGAPGQMFLAELGVCLRVILSSRLPQSSLISHVSLMRTHTNLSRVHVSNFSTIVISVFLF